MFVLVNMVSLGLRDICLRNATILIDSKLSSRTWELLESLLRQLEMYFNALISIDISYHISLIEHLLCCCYMCSSTRSSVGISASRAQQNPLPEPSRAYLQRFSFASRLLGAFPGLGFQAHRGPWVPEDQFLSADGVRIECGRSAEIHPWPSQFHPILPGTRFVCIRVSSPETSREVGFVL